MKRLTLAISLLLSAPLAMAAGTTAIAPGTLSTTGPTLDHHALFAATHNPAMADLMVRPGESWRTNYFVGLGTNFEIGDANDFLDKLEELVDILDDPSLATDSVQETLDEFNGVLESVGEQGYLKNSTRLYLPGLPLYFNPKGMEGTWFVEAAVDTQWRLNIIDDELSFDDQNQSFQTGSAAYLKSGIQQRISVGYGREIFSELSLNGKGGRFLAGLTVNLYQLELSKQLYLLQELDGDSNNVQDVAEDQYNDHLVSTTNFGIDAGLVWDANWYRLGLTLSDINSPEFEYGSVGVNCDHLTEDTSRRSNCESSIETVINGRIAANEVHTKHASARVDGTVFPLSNLSVSGSMELAPYDDIVGMENQWASVSTSYTPKNMFIPAVRVGLHQNLAGSELTSYALGLTFFKVLSLDVSASSETVEHEGTEAPRRFSFSLSFEESF